MKPKTLFFFLISDKHCLLSPTGGKYDELLLSKWVIHHKPCFQKAKDQKSHI